VRDPYFGGQGEGKATGFMVHDVRSVAGYHGNELGRYDVLTGWESEDYLARMSDANVRRLLNVRYLYTNSATSPIAGARLVAGPARNAAGNTAYLYELPEDNPAAWVVPLAVKAPDDNVLATLLDARFDVRRAALFDTAAAAVPARPVPPALPAPSDVAVRVTRWEPGRIALALDRPAPEGSALLVSENYYPGWSATVDGKAAPVGRADYVLTGVGLPAGAQAVELTFHSPRYATGKAVTLAALLLAALWSAAGVLHDRRRRWRRQGDAELSR
ncbi:MAG TPA: YfhO family protein, partial [Gemmatimonadaceae bacterium]|nr:YfhO family protein [Gemmatimonadaceae bacterium]